MHEFKPVKNWLKSKTLWVVTDPNYIESYIIYPKRYSKRCGISGYTILAKGPLLQAEQITALQKLILDPKSYYNGWPIYRRLPPVPGFAFRIFRDDQHVDLMVDLHNPGWEFICDDEFYGDWNWVGTEITGIAKSLFPEYASPNPRYIWRKGAIKNLLTQSKKENNTL